MRVDVPPRPLSVGWTSKKKENRSRLLFEVLGALCAACGPGRVGVRLSPGFGVSLDSDPDALHAHAIAGLNRLPLACPRRENGELENDDEKGQATK